MELENQIKHLFTLFNFSKEDETLYRNKYDNDLKRIMYNLCSDADALIEYNPDLKYKKIVNMLREN